MSELKKTIIAIGGENWEDLRGSTLSIDEEIVRCGRARRKDGGKPNFLFVPTAQVGESIELAYRKAFLKHFKDLGCTVDELYMNEEFAPTVLMHKLVGEADIIYVGGGNTLRMMQMWKRYGFDTLLRDAYERGVVLSGVSAGAICWFQSGHSDSLSFWRPADWKYMMVEGLGLIPAMTCPHYDGQTLWKPRAAHFAEMMRGEKGVAIALENEAALQIVDDTWRVLASKPGKAAHRVYYDRGTIFDVVLDPSDEFRPMAELTKR